MYCTALRLKAFIGLFAWTFQCAIARGPTPLRDPLVRVSRPSDPIPNYKVREVVVEAEPEHTCPNGYEQVGGNCLQVESIAVTPQCPPGWEFDDERISCIGYTNVPPEHTCDEGHPSYNECIAERTAPKLMACPEGYSLRPDYKDCVREIVHKANLICPMGTRLINELCITVRSELPLTRCPGGFLLEDGQCKRAVEDRVVQTCPADYKMGDGKSQRCEKIIMKQPSRKCPVGFELVGGDCLTEVHVPPTMICRQGKMVDNVSCMIKQRELPHLQCKVGTLNGITGMCEMDDVTKPLAECTKGTIFNPITNQCGSANKLKQPNLACPPDYHFVGKSHCVRHIEEPPHKVCPPGFQLVSKDECIRKDTILPEARCPPGTNLVGNICVAVKTIPFDLYCDKGLTLEKRRCVARVFHEGLASCAAGFTMTPDQRCLREEIAPPKLLCPPNTEQRADSNGMVCLLADEAPAARTCPPHLEMRTNSCVELLHALPSSTCPPGYFEDLKTQKCYVVDHSPRRTFCPSGYKIMGGECIKVEHTVPLSSCPSNFKVMDNGEGPICVLEKLAPQVHICPLGFRYEHGKCLATTLQYEFDEEEPQEPLENPEPAPEEAQKDLSAPEVPTAAPVQEPTIEVVVNRPVVQKGLVMRNQPITLSGPAAEVARQQAILNSGGSLTGSQDVDIEYVPTIHSGLI